jgi:FixJ family two-component response regulator
MVSRVHVIDQNVRRRAWVSRELLSNALHAEIYEDVNEFLANSPSEGLILAANDRDDGARVCEIVGMSGVELPVVGYAEDPSTEEVVEAMIAGAAGFLNWPCVDRELLIRLNRMVELSGQRMRRERMLARARDRVEGLTLRERQVLISLVAGMSNNAIAKALGISPRTVEIHRAKMMSRLGARSAAEAVKIGLYAGLDEVRDSLLLGKEA